MFLQAEMSSRYKVKCGHLSKCGDVFGDVEMVRSTGVEPARYCYRQPLKLERLPFRHDRNWCARRDSNPPPRFKRPELRRLSFERTEMVAEGGNCTNTDDWLMRPVTYCLSTPQSKMVRAAGVEPARFPSGV